MALKASLLLSSVAAAEAGLEAASLLQTRQRTSKGTSDEPRVSMKEHGVDMLKVHGHFEDPTKIQAWSLSLLDDGDLAPLTHHYAVRGAGLNKNRDIIYMEQCVADGDKKANFEGYTIDNNGKNYFNDRQDNIGVTCCNTAGVARRPSCDAYGKTYAEALKLCEDNGLQLCTRAQLSDGAGTSKGCKFDHILNWVSDTCEVTYHMVARGSGGESPVIPFQEQCVRDGNRQVNRAGYIIDNIGINRFKGNDKYNIGVTCCNGAGVAQKRTCHWKAKTYTEAVNLCHTGRWTLCTREQLARGVGKSKGCGFDHLLNWVSDSCNTAPIQPDPDFKDGSKECKGGDLSIVAGSSNEHTFRCAGGFCLPKKGYCNGVNNCNDGSDEVGCPTTTTTPKPSRECNAADCNDHGTTWDNDADDGCECFCTHGYSTPAGTPRTDMQCTQPPQATPQPRPPWPRPPSDGACDPMVHCNGHGMTMDTNKEDGCSCMCLPMGPSGWSTHPDATLTDTQCTVPAGKTACTGAQDCNGHGITLDVDKSNGCDCTCTGGYTSANGLKCNVAPTLPCDAATDCSGHGTTSDNDNSDGCVCSCDAGYAGTKCNELATTPCNGQTDCSGHGHTNDKDNSDGCTCHCRAPYAGTDCSTRLIYPDTPATLHQTCKLAFGATRDQCQSCDEQPCCYATWVNYGDELKGGWKGYLQGDNRYNWKTSTCEDGKKDRYCGVSFKECRDICEALHEHNGEDGGLARMAGNYYSYHSKLQLCMCVKPGKDWGKRGAAAKADNPTIRSEGCNPQEHSNGIDAFDTWCTFKQPDSEEAEPMCRV